MPIVPQPSGLLIVVGTDPAAGVEVSQTVPAGKFWRLRALTVTLVTNATVANRSVALVFDDGTNEFARVVANAVQAASLTRVYSFQAGGVTAVAQPQSGLQVAMPEFVLKPGFRVRTITDLKDAGDNFGAPVLAVVEYTDAV